MFRLIFATLVLFAFDATSTHAGEPTPSAGTSATNQFNRVYDSIPADAFFVAYVRDIDEALSQPLLQPFFNEAPEVKPVFTAMADAFDGPLALSISGTPVMPFLWRFTIITQSTLDEAAMNERLSSLAAAWNVSPLSVAGSLSFVEGDVDRILFAGPASFTLDVARQNDLFIATNLAGYDQWLQSAPPDGLFANKPEWARMNAGLASTPATFAFLDLRAIVPLAMIPLGNSLPKLYEALQLASLKSVAIIVGQTPPIVVVPNEPGAKAVDARKKLSAKSKEVPDEPQTESKPVLRVAVSAKNDVPGPWHFLASDPMTPTLTAAYPTDTTMFFHGSMSSAAGLMDDVLAIQGVIDRVLTDEYAQERSDFQRDVGFDPHADFLANLSTEWAFGGKLGEHGIEQPLFTVRIADEDRFRAQLHSLRNYFKLQTTITNYRGVNIETAERNAGNFSFALAKKTLLLSPEPQAVADAVDALLDKQSLSQARGFTDAKRFVTEPTSKFAYVNLASAVSLLRTGIPDAKLRDSLTRAASKGDLTLAVIPHEGVITADLHIGMELGSVVALAISDSLKEARKQNARVVSMANMRGIVTSCIIYAAENKNRWPDSLNVLYDQGAISSQNIGNPYEGTPAAPNESYYLYRKVNDPRSVKELDKELVLAESVLRDGGACFAFMDGHVEYITGQQAERMLAAMKKVK